jgi:hypothetical protein
MKNEGLVYKYLSQMLSASQKLEESCARWMNLCTKCFDSIAKKKKKAKEKKSNHYCGIRKACSDLKIQKVRWRRISVLVLAMPILQSY